MLTQKNQKRKKKKRRRRRREKKSLILKIENFSYIAWLCYAVPVF
jgi:hypothetical protein